MLSNSNANSLASLKAMPVTNLVRPGRARAFSAGGDEVHDTVYYAKCLVGGVLSCGLTHTLVVPLDIVKCRMQTQPEVYKGVMQGFNVALKDGVKSLSVGWAPTFIGYSVQGLFKFGCYEIFKDLYSKMISEENAIKYRSILYGAASASAEFIADAAFCPMEAVKVRMQTSLPEAGFPKTLMPALSSIMREEGLRGFYKGLAPLWARQVPYTVVKFVAFERVVETFYTYVFTKPKDSYSKSTQLGVTFASGYIAGVFCAIISHPADTIVSKLNQNDKARIGQIISEYGIFKLLTSGLMARIVMIGTLTGLQWWIYDTWKTLMGLKTTGGAVKDKAPVAGEEKKGDRK